MIKKKFDKINNEEVKLLSSEIVDEGGAVLNNLFNYSTNEQVIGTWIDGKPIYRKIVKYEGEFNASKSTPFPHGITNLGYVVSVQGMVLYTNDTQYVNGAWENQDKFINIKWVNKDEIGVQVGTEWVKSFSGIIIIIEYTKTTN